MPGQPTEDQDDLRRRRGRNRRRGHRFHQPQQHPMPPGRVARPGRCQPRRTDTGPANTQRLRRAGAHHPPSSDHHARPAGGSGLGWRRSARTRHHQMPARLPATARHTPWQRPRYRHLGVDSQLRCLPARLQPHPDITRHTRLSPAFPPAPSCISPSVQSPHGSKTLGEPATDQGKPHSRASSGA
jgi:hypothetical protein